MCTLIGVLVSIANDWIVPSVCLYASMKLMNSRMLAATTSLAGELSAYIYPREERTGSRNLLTTDEKQSSVVGKSSPAGKYCLKDESVAKPPQFNRSHLTE